PASASTPPRSNRSFHRATVAVEQNSTAQMADHACPSASSRMMCARRRTSGSGSFRYSPSRRLRCRDSGQYCRLPWLGSQGGCLSNNNLGPSHFLFQEELFSCSKSSMSRGRLALRFIFLSQSSETKR